MTIPEILKYRLYRQQIALHPYKKAAEVVSGQVAMQAQDYAGAKWSIGLRLPDATDSDIEQAIAARTIVRTWPMRGTLHFVSADDIRWMLKLLTPHIIAGSAGRHRQLELDEKDFARSKKLFIKALQGGKQLTRNEMYTVLERAKISTAGQRGIHILQRNAMEGLICFSSHQGKQPAFALLEEWLPPAKKLSHEESLAELALRYFKGHGPATLRDFAGWSGLKITDARAGLQAVDKELLQDNINGTTYWMSNNIQSVPNISKEVFLLPGFDEYMLGYKDRNAALSDPKHAQIIVPGNNGLFKPTIVINGRIAGTWKRIIKKKTISIELFPFAALSKARRRQIEKAAGRYGEFMKMPVTQICFLLILCILSPLFITT